MTVPKLNKEQLQKIMLSLIMLIVFVAAYHSFLLKPLGVRAAKARLEIADLQAKVTEADKQITKANQLREQSVAAGETLAHFTQSIPEGSPIAWFPLRMSAFFTRHNIEGITTRQVGVLPIKDGSLAGWSELNWTIELPSAGYIPAGIAISALENEEMLMEITELSISANEQNPEFQQISLNTIILLKQ